MKKIRKFITDGKRGMEMRKITCIIVCVLTIISIAFCITSCKSREKRLNEETTYEDKQMHAMEEKVIGCIKNDDKEGLKKLFSKRAQKDIEDLVIDASKTKKVVVKHYDKRSAVQKESSEKEFKGILIDASVGTIKFEGKSYLLDYIYSAGLGSVTGSGFGMLEII